MNGLYIVVLCAFLMSCTSIKHVVTEEEILNNTKEISMMMGTFWRPPQTYSSPFRSCELTKKEDVDYIVNLIRNAPKNFIEKKDDSASLTYVLRGKLPVGSVQISIGILQGNLYELFLTDEENEQIVRLIDHGYFEQYIKKYGNIFGERPVLPLK